MVFLEMLDLRTLIRKLLNSFQDDLYTCISSFSLSFFLSSLGQRSLVGYSLWGCKESNTTEQLSTHTHHEQLRIYSKNLTLLAATWKAALVMSFLECSPKFSVSIIHA